LANLLLRRLTASSVQSCRSTSLSNSPSRMNRTRSTSSVFFRSSERFRAVAFLINHSLHCSTLAVSTRSRIMAFSKNYQCS
jgi:hypothetical protein